MGRLSLSNKLLVAFIGISLLAAFPSTLFALHPDLLNISSVAPLTLSISLLACGLVGRAVSLWMSRRIETLQRSVEDLRQGRSPAALPLLVRDTVLPDETDELFHQFALLSAEIADIIRSTREASGAIEESAREVATWTRNLSNTSRQVVFNAGQVNSNATSQAQFLGTARDGLVELEKQMGRTGASVARSHESSTRASEVAEGSQAVVSDAVAKLGSAFSALEEMSQQVSSFTERTQGILRFSQTITDISQNTDILAINASLGLDRGGDARELLGVVEQVKGLATRVGTAADEIAQLTAELIAEREKVSRAVALGRRQIRAGRRDIAGLERAMGRIGDLSQEVAHTARRVISENESQTRTISGLNQQMATVAQRARENAVNTDSLNRTAASQAADIESLDRTADRLLEVARGLALLVGRFEAVDEAP